MGQLKILYKKVADKGWGMHFENITKSLRDEIVYFISANTTMSGAPWAEPVKKACVFIQTDRWADSRTTDESGYLFIEMSSRRAQHVPFMRVLMDNVVLKHPDALVEAPVGVEYIRDPRDPFDGGESTQELPLKQAQLISQTNSGYASRKGLPDGEILLAETTNWDYTGTVDGMYSVVRMILKPMLVNGLNVYVIQVSLHVPVLRNRSDVLSRTTRQRTTDGPQYFLWQNYAHACLAFIHRSGPALGHVPYFFNEQEEKEQACFCGSP